ncbi:hypothetical protein MTO96_049303 [Rhipicephalus appendiculatus]
MRRKWVLGFISAAFLMGMIISVAFTYQLGFFGTPCVLPLLRTCARRDQRQLRILGPALVFAVVLRAYPPQGPLHAMEFQPGLPGSLASTLRQSRPVPSILLEKGTERSLHSTHRNRHAAVHQRRLPGGTQKNVVVLRQPQQGVPPVGTDSLLYGPERLGHQTQLMREHINKVTTVLCVAIGLVLLIFFLATVALLVAALGTGPKRHRSVETTTESEATTPPHRNKSGKMSHPRAMIEVTPFDAAVRESRCDAPRLVHCSSNLTTLVRDHGWFYMPGAGNPGGCVEWLPAHLCVVQKGFREGGGYRFSTREECSTLCERGTPRRECVQPLPLTAVYNCTHAAVQDQQHWWFYDIVSHACREWEHACVYKSYATMAHCVRDCLPEPRQSS